MAGDMSTWKAWPRSAPRASGAAALVLACAGGAAAQCQPAWTGYPAPYLDASVSAIATWDSDGAGPRPADVVAVGNFQGAGATTLNFVGRWDGTEWRPLSTGTSGTTYAVKAIGEPASPVAGLYIGGIFSQASGNVVNRIARFDGETWQGIGGGVTIPGSSFLPTVYTLGSHQGSLIAAGLFTHAGPVLTNGLARWNGQSWHAYPEPKPGNAKTLEVFNGVLHAGGYFSMDPGNPSALTGVLRWTGAAWETIGTNYPRDDVFALAMYGGELYAGGFFTNQCCGHPAAPGEFITRFDGQTWRPVGTGVNWTVRAMKVFDPDGPGPLPARLIVGGGFDRAGGLPASGIAAWDGTNWAALGAGVDGGVRSMAIWRNRLVVAGEFWSAGGVVSPGMAFWGCPQPEPCLANCDGSTNSPMLNIDDFTCFINQFAAGAALPHAQQVLHYANCDESTIAPVLNVDDFTCFISNYAAGCK
jgi:trimeric autotransporter adhesin